MKLKFKKLSEKAVIPTRAHDDDAGFDLTATEISTQINKCGQLVMVYHSGIAVEIPNGYVGLLFERSSVYETSLILSNCVGVIDSGYRGEIQAVFRNTTDVIPNVYNVGERFAQLVVMKLPEIEFVESDKLSASSRGDGGFGSTDKKDSAVAESDKPETIVSDQSVPEQAADQN